MLVIAVIRDGDEDIEMHAMLWLYIAWQGKLLKVLWLHCSVEMQPVSHVS